MPLAGRRALGYSRSDWDATNGDPAKGDIDSPQAGLYARYAGDAWRLRLDATYADHDFSTERTLSIGQSRSTADSSHRGRSGGWPRRSRRWCRWASGSCVRWPACAMPICAKTPSPRPAPAPPPSRCRAHHAEHAVLLWLARHPAVQRGRGGLELRAIASHLAGDNDSPITASLAGQPGSFTAHGAPLKRDALTLGTTLSGQFTRSVSGYLDLNYEYRGSGQNAYQATAGVKVSF